MDTKPFEAHLKATLDDERLSRTERDALLALLKENGAPGSAPEHLAQLRASAFRLVEEHIVDPKVRLLLAWLEDVIKVMARVAPPAPTHSSKAYFSPGNDCRHAVIGEFGRAKKSADVCVFTITDDRITDAILAAHRRGVRVRVITDDDKSLDVGSDAERLARAGIVLRIDRTEHHMHHKYALFDELRLLNGSYNFTRSASEFNEENLILTEEEALVRVFREHFEGLWTALEN